jgi:hypothetical protein
MRTLMPASLSNVRSASPANAPARSLRANTWRQPDVDHGRADDRLSRCNLDAVAPDRSDHAQYLVAPKPHAGCCKGTVPTQQDTKACSAHCAWRRAALRETATAHGRAWLKARGDTIWPCVCEADVAARGPCTTVVPMFLAATVGRRTQASARPLLDEIARLISTRSVVTDAAVHTRSSRRAHAR